MDPVTHGITGALLGKAYFSKREARVTIFAATLGAVFSDIDVVAEAFSRDPMAIVKYHRGITHSFFGLPFFALGLAWLTCWATRRWKIPSPSLAMLTLVYGVGILSHILLDGMTSFGTRMWTPFSERRVAWDWLFIIDVTLTSIGLLPQLLAWIYRDRAKSAHRAAWLWLAYTLALSAVWAAARRVDSPFSAWAGAAASLMVAILFFAPALGGSGFRLSRAAWCQTGVLAMIAYLGACGVAHHVALSKVKEFAAENHLDVVRMGALPVPPCLLDWGDAIRVPNGVYQARFDLRDSNPPDFQFHPDSPPDAFTARALELPEVHLYWNFARFPVIRASIEDDRHIVNFGENRFVSRSRGPQPFTYSVVFDASGKVIEQGWLRNGMFLRNMQKPAPPSGNAR
ncbi:MAG TPA: metal-dependent hydrolase [Candidatus Cybelea sp.]|nr:metal-dependent hydrolase [Candidatus Cybelea sp.]